MFIVPYYIVKHDSEDFRLWTAWVFMAKGGTKLWETDEPTLTQAQISESYLEPNGIYGKPICIKENTLFFNVDTTKTQIQDFYIWTEFLEKSEEIPQTVDVWRPILWLSDFNSYPGEKDEWGWHGEVRQGFMHSIWNSLSQVLRDGN